MLLCLAPLTPVACMAGSKRPKMPVAEGRPLVEIGQGARLREGQKLYEMSLWVDRRDGERAFPALVMRAGGRDHAQLTHGAHAGAFVIWGHFTKRAVLTFASAVPATVMRQEFEAALADHKGGAELLALFEDATAGQKWVLTTGDNGQIDLQIGAVHKRGPQSPKLVRALWSAWLGSRPLSVELRQALIDHIDILGRYSRGPLD